MHAHKLRVTIPKDHRLQLAVDLPADFPPGPAEVIVLAALSQPSDETGIERRQRHTLTVLEEIRSTELTKEEEEILDEFESFRREHPFRLASLDED